MIAKSSCHVSKRSSNREEREFGTLVTIFSSHHIAPNILNKEYRKNKLECLQLISNQLGSNLIGI